MRLRFAVISWLSVSLVLLAGGCRPVADERQAPANDRGAEPPQSITTKLGIEMVRIPGGDFVMGDDGGEEDQRPAHRVQISPFAMDVCEVTQESYRTLMGKNPAKFTGSDHPVERVSWYSATQYCNMRSLREGFTPCYHAETLECDFAADGYRLPTEAEWEYACRAGTTSQWSFGNDLRAVGKHTWYHGNAAKKTHPVRQKAPNPWGLYDMHGNVAEWCNDFISESYDPSVADRDPLGPSLGDERVLRGGSWQGTADACRSAARNSETPRFADACFGTEAYGFRCVCRVEP